MSKAQSIPAKILGFDYSEYQLRADIEHYHTRDWAKALRRYEEEPTDFYNAYEFLRLHPANQRYFPVGGRPAYGPDSWFDQNFTILVVKVDPETKHTEMKGQKYDKKRNTETRVWIEWGPWVEADKLEEGWGTVTPQGMRSHDPRVDTGGATFEEAIVNLAHNVYILYGDQADVPNDKKLKRKDRW